MCSRDKHPVPWNTMYLLASHAWHGAGGTSSLNPVPITSGGSKETLGPVQLLRAPLPEGPCMIQTKASEEHSGHEAYHWLIIIYCSRCCCFMFHNASSLNILRYRYDLVINTRFDNFIYILCRQQEFSTYLLKILSIKAITKSPWPPFFVYQWFFLRNYLRPG